MNPYWEKSKSLTSPTHVLSKGEVTAVAPNIFPRQGIPDATRIHYGYKEMDAYRRPNARLNSYPISLPKCINEVKAHGRESAVGKPDSRQNSSTRAISDIPPSQPRRRRRISGEPIHVAAKERYKDADAGEAHQRGSSALKRLQQTDSKWNSGSGALTDRPPLRPFIRHGIIVASCASTKEYHKDPLLEELRAESSIKRLQQSDASRWSSGYPSSFDMSPFQALAGSSLRSLEYYDDSSWTSGYRTT
jgi:hypothetical protein